MSDLKKEISKDLDKSIGKSISEAEKQEKKLFLYNKNIAISISESEEIEELGFSKIHQQDIILEITRYLIINGATLVYGGDLRSQGYTFLFSELVEQYTSGRNKNFYKNYFSFPIYVQMSQIHRLEFKKYGVDIINIPPPENLDIDSNTFYPPTDNENLFIWAESLSKMRREMCKDSSARVFMGGARTNFKGKYPGLLEETILSLETNTPTYFIGAFGGITKNIIEAILGKQPDQITEAWHKTASQKYGDFIDFYNKKDNVEKIDYTQQLAKLNDFTLEKLCKNNGLDEEENIRLFETIHLPEIIYLILKGLKSKL